MRRVRRAIVMAPVVGLRLKSYGKRRTLKCLKMWRLKRL